MVVINNSHPEVLDRRYERITSDESSGWAVALLLLLALAVLGLLFWWRGHAAVAPVTTPGDTVHISAPGGVAQPPNMQSTATGNTNAGTPASNVVTPQPPSTQNP